MENYQTPENRRPQAGNRAIIGLVLILAGFFLLLRNTNIIPSFINDIVFSWQMLLIVIGLVITVGNSDKTAGIIVMAVGAFFLLPQIFSDIFGTYRVFWPAIFIAAGVLFIVGGRKATQKLFNHHDGESSEDYIDLINVFSGGDRLLRTENFSGGKITSVFGGSKIDLTKCRLAPGTSYLEITCVFGGTEIIVPEEWTVVLNVTPVLGGFSDERKFSQGRASDSGKQLIIKGFVIFGGGDLKSY
jgi:predicted membrane protein